MVAFRKRGSNAMKANDFLKLSSNSLQSAETNLNLCEASVSPALDKMSDKVSKAKTHLQLISDRRLGASKVSQPQPCSGVRVLLKRAFSTPQEDIDFKDLRIIEEKSRTLVQQTTRTSSRREGYMGLLNVIGSHKLPDKDHHLPEGSKAAELESLTRDDLVHETKIYEVSIKDGSYLDSSKYQSTGPRLITLAEKTINLMVYSQNSNDRVVKMANNIHCLVLLITHDMRDYPDDTETHLNYISKVSSIVDELVDTSQGLKYPKYDVATVSACQRQISEARRSFDMLRSSRSTEQKAEDITETDDEIILLINGTKYTHKKELLTWKYLREEVIPPFKIPTLEISIINRDTVIEGGFAVIDCGLLPEGTKVALKSSKKSGEEQSVLCLRFIRELYIWGKAGDNPFVQKLIGVCFLPSGCPAMVSPWRDDGDLHTYLKDAKLDRKGQLELALQICSGLKHLHECNIVHADLKTDNILIENGKAKLHDFGISRIMNDATGLLTRVHGHCRYQAHEVLEAQKGNLHSYVTAKSDVFSFGRVLYECLTGCVPFSNITSDPQVIKDVKNLKRPTDSEYKTTVDGEGKEECIRLMKDCWHESPVPRPSAAQLVDRLQEIINKIKV